MTSRVEGFTTLNAFVVSPRDPENPMAQYRELTPDEQRAIRCGKTGESLAVLQACVSDVDSDPRRGSLIEPVYFPDESENRKWTVYVNEEGLLFGMEHNHAASLILQQPIVGPVVFHPAEWTRY